MSEESESGRKLRAKERKKYIDQDIDEDDIDGKRMYSVEEKLLSDKFTADMVLEMKGPEFNMGWMQKNGLTRPIVFYDKAGLGLRVPSENFKVSDVKQCVGSRRILDVMDVTTQKGKEMSMKDWVKYFENPERDRLLNVISLEFCHTRLENYVESPTLVRQIDWVDRAWPRHLKECQTEATNVIQKMKYPKVQKYCLMSVAGCYTDFHIDFGGTSVWYHILHGEKIFWLAPPSKGNIERYTEWTLSAKQGDSFLGDSLEQCQRITLQAGYTFIIPSGWIHAVYTPKDSLVFGGNFLHSFNIENQLLVSRIEDKTYVPAKFRYPFLSEIMWYVIDRYLACVNGETYLAACDKEEADDHYDDPGFIHVDDESRPPSRNPDSRPPSRTMDDTFDSTKIKSESGEDTPKLSKSVTIELTRIDAALSRAQSEEDGSITPKVRAPRKAISDSAASMEGNGCPKKWVHLTAVELKGLHQMVDYLSGLMALPPSKRGVPKEMIDPEGALRGIRQLLEDHKHDNPELAATGEPVISWPESPKKKQQKLKLGYKTFKTAKAGKGPSSVKRRRTRCKQCEACTRSECGECTFCKDMKKFGGPGRMKQTCVSRQCMAPILPSSSVCVICNQEGQTNNEDPDDIAMSLMECGICWEIVHPLCLQKKYESLDEGNINEDLPSSWECPRCCTDGKQGQLKPRVRPGFSAKRPKTGNSADSDGSHDESQEEDPVSPVSPVEGKRVVSKEEGNTRQGREKVDANTANGKWSKKVMTLVDVKPKMEDRASPVLSTEEVYRKKPSHASGGALGDAKRVVKKEKTSAPNSPSSQQEDSSRSGRKRSSTPGQPVSGKGSSHNARHESPSQEAPGSKRPKREGFSLGAGEGVGHSLDSAPHLAGGSGQEDSPFSVYGSKKSRVKVSSTKLDYNLMDVDNHDGMQSSSSLLSSSSSVYPQMPSSSLSSMSLPAMSYHHPASGTGAMPVTSALSTAAAREHAPASGQEQYAMVHIKQECAMSSSPVASPADLLSTNSQTMAGLPSELVSPEKQRWGVNYAPKVPLKNYVVRPPPPAHIPEYVSMTDGLPHSLPRALWTLIFRYLPQADLAKISGVCHTFDCWVLDPSLWYELDLSRTSIKQTHLKGVMLRQPRSLKLASSVVSYAELSWLLARLPGLRHLDLSNLSWASICALCSPDCPLLQSLHLRWATGIRDLCFRELASPPPNLKPGQNNISRLCRLERLSLTGTDINDQSLETLATHLPKLVALDLTCCMRVTDRGIRALVQLGRPCHLRELHLVKCVQLTERCLDSLASCRELGYLALTDIPAITQEACVWFSRSYKHRTLRAHAHGIISV